MKKQTLLFYLLMLVGFSSCRWHHHGYTDISYNESGHYYSMKAYFNKNKTRKVENYMDERIGDRSKFSFVSTRIDGQIALDDRTTFYIKKYPGQIKIRLNKYENSEASYERVREMCEGIKEILSEN